MGLLELLLVFGVVIAWALWEIHSTARAQREDRDQTDQSPPGDPDR